MSSKQIIQQAIDQVGEEIGRLQGKLFIAEAHGESLRTRIQRLDAVFQNLQSQLSNPAPSKTLLSEDETCEILHNQLPMLDPASQGVCQEVLNLLMQSLHRGEGPTPADRATAVARMESHAWKQGEAIALAQRIVQFLRN